MFIIIIIIILNECHCFFFFFFSRKKVKVSRGTISGSSRRGKITDTLTRFEREFLKTKIIFTSVSSIRKHCGSVRKQTRRFIRIKFKKKTSTFHPFSTLASMKLIFDTSKSFVHLLHTPPINKYDDDNDGDARYVFRNSYQDPCYHLMEKKDPIQASAVRFHCLIGIRRGALLARPRSSTSTAG